MSKFQNYLKTFDITSTLTEEDIDKTLALLQIYGPAVRRTASRIGEMEEECYEGRRQSISDFINLAIDYDRDTDRKRIADRLAEMGHSMQLLSVMEDALVLVKDTPPNGGTYFNILQARYFDVYCTSNEEAYVLTLFAIAKELERRKVPETLDPIDITLLVGLPPAHYEQLHSRFEQYFLRRREIVDFEYNGKYYSIRVSKVLSYPQAFAAAVTQFGTLKAHSVAYIIDIGGFTIDVLKLRSGRPDLAVVESFEKGVITLYNGIASKCNALYARILEDCDIDEVIRNQPTVLPGEVQQLIRTMTSDFLTEFYNFLRERGVDVSTSKCVFAGGGSLLLRGMIERGNKVAFPIFIEDIHANARGYELLYQSEVAANGQQ